MPLDGHISFADLAKDVGLKQSDLERMLRFAMIYHRIFQEKEPGFVSHTAASRLLVESPSAMAGLGFMFDECYQSFAHTVEAIDVYKDPKPNQSVSVYILRVPPFKTSASDTFSQGWAIAKKADVSMWEYHTEHPELGERSALAMHAFSKGFNLDTTALTRGYDWSSINAEKGTLVDMGGANGHAAVAIARANSGMHCVVQEIPEVVAKAKYQVPNDVADRVSFVAHDFFQPQPTIAQAYLFRQIFHNWEDSHCVRMLRALIPALKPGAKVIANDLIVPSPGVMPPMQERAVRSMDMIMMSLFNSREREKKDWEALFAEADSRFQDVKVWQPAGSQLGLIEATWSG